MTVDEMIAVLQAYKAGKTIQFKPHVKSEWTTIDGEPSWLFPFCDYRIFKEDVPDELIDFEHLGENGIKAGDIVAVTSSLGGNKISAFYLLRSGLPDKLNTALCCGILPNEDLYLAQLGFAWQGAVRQKFRKATEEECNKFIDACIKELKDKKSTWCGRPGSVTDNFRLDQILASMIKWNLITKDDAKKLDRSLKRIHGRSVLVEANKWL